MDSNETQSVISIERSTLQGRVRISGAKNSALRLLAASLLTDGAVELSNFPSSILDAQVHIGMLRALGKDVEVTGDRVIISEPNGLTRDLHWTGRSIRNTLLILGALLTRFGYASVPLPGGCNLGERKYDLHELVLRTLGAAVWVEGDRLYASARGRLRGAEVVLPLRSTGATENALIAAALADGVTEIWNPHVRPEIMDLITFLNSMGASIECFGQERLVVHGVEGLSGRIHSVIPDNVEAITWMIGSAVTSGDVEILGFPTKHLEVPLAHLRESGCRYYQDEDRVLVRGASTYPVEIATGPYPGINSDMQPLFAVFGAIARGESRIVDLRFPGRYQYADELAKLGVRHAVKGDVLHVYGGQPLVGATVKALDLRAGVALAIAGLCAEGTTTITDCWQIERGYDRFVEKMQLLGAKVERDE